MAVTLLHLRAIFSGLHQSNAIKKAKYNKNNIFLDSGGFLK